MQHQERSIYGRSGLKIMITFVPVVVYCHQLYPVNLENVKGLKNIYKEEKKGYGDILASHFVLSFKESWQEGRLFSNTPSAQSDQESHQLPKVLTIRWPQTKVRCSNHGKPSKKSMYHFEKFAVNLKDRSGLLIQLHIK